VIVLWYKFQIRQGMKTESYINTEPKKIVLNDDLRLKILLEILQTASLINNLHLKYLTPFNLSVQQYNILRILRNVYPGSLTIQSIKEQMIDRTPNTTRMVDKLLLQKFVTRIRSVKDRRKVFVKITASGLEIMGQTDVNLQDFLKITNNLSAAETNQLSGLLGKLRE
jgi:MarR family transcriptional regulator, 2-MHQ and catechol-resistance regulon repressor